MNKKDKEKVIMRSVIKEELVLLTMSRNEAAILNQFLYWTPKTYDYSSFLLEEKQKLNKESLGEDTAIEHGWISKTADQLRLELLMIDTNVKTIRSYLNSLVKKGFILRRNNPRFKMIKTYQYRINLRIIVDRLNEMGYVLEGFEQFSMQVNHNRSKFTLSDESKMIEVVEIDNSEKRFELLENDQKDLRRGQLGSSKGENSAREGDLSAAILENTSETNSKKNDTNNTNKDLENIEKEFMGFTSKKEASKEDKRLIAETFNLVGDSNKVIDLMNTCFENKQTYSRSDKAIWSFKYFKNYIEKELSKENEQPREVLLEHLSGGDSKVFNESITVESSPLGEWMDDIKCNF